MIPRPVILAGAGAVIHAGGFVYDMLFAGIPHRDLSPEAEAAWLMHGAHPPVDIGKEGELYWHLLRADRSE